MTVNVSGNIEPDGGYSFVGREASADEIVVLVRSVVERGKGYLELSPTQGGYPLLAFSVRTPHAVVHGFPADDVSELLVGDGSLPDDEVGRFPIYNSEDVKFTGDSVLSVDRLASLVETFVTTRSLESIGTWERL